VLGFVADLLWAVSTVEQIDAQSIALILRPSQLIQLTLHGLILLYLFKGTVRTFFGLKSLRIGRALLLLAFIAIVVLAATFGAMYFLTLD
jgi:hypothetical protein